MLPWLDLTGSAGYKALPYLSPGLPSGFFGNGLPDPDTVLDQYLAPFLRPLTSDLMLLDLWVTGKGAKERGC